MGFDRRALAAPPKPPTDATGPMPAPQDGIPPHVWDLLQRAGERGAERLLELLESPAFKNYAPSAKARLIELAMVRAYGLPVRRSVEVKLSSDDTDAVAASLASLRDSLPERGPNPRQMRSNDIYEAEPPDE